MANGLHETAPLDCVEACSRILAAARNALVFLDDDLLILTEYRSNLSHSGQPGVGDAFFKWIWDNQGNPNHCRKVPITPDENGGREFLEFPDDPELEMFDRSDRKFVAVAVASNSNPAIINASDSDWHIFGDALNRYVRLQFICPQLMPGVL